MLKVGDRVKMETLSSTPTGTVEEINNTGLLPPICVKWDGGLSQYIEEDVLKKIRKPKQPKQGKP